MRTSFVASILAVSLMACGTPMMETDTGVIDSGVVQDVFTPDTGTPPVDAGGHCDFTPGPMSTTCRILASTCMTGPVDCGGGVTFTNITCHCATIHMGNQVWQCDNFCPVDAGVDAGTDASNDTGTGTDAGTDTGTATDAGTDTGTATDAGTDAATE